MTSTFFQRILILVLLAGCMTGLHAQEYKYEIGGMAGGAFYMGDVNKNAFFKGLNPAFGAVFRYNPNFRWAVKTNLMWGQVSGTTEGQQNVFPDHAQGSFSRSLIELGGQIGVQLLSVQLINLRIRTQGVSLPIFLWDWV